MIGLPPGTILQLMYLRERLIINSDKLRFLDIGAGNGMISKLLLDLGHNGIAIDLNLSACEKNRVSNQKAISENRFSVVNSNFLEYSDSNKFDLIIASMVIEHLPKNTLIPFIAHCKELLKSEGKIVFLVPSSMKYWGIEDEIAGHVLRYEYEDVYKLGEEFELNIKHIAGLTYPLSNWLFKLSNRIIQSKESDKLKLSEQDRTVYTGNRELNYKTQFPAIFNVILNPIVLYPLYLLQKLNLKQRNAMVLYMELTKIKEA
jgi:2-polyprenyl-3-methyl-5-hydroxy-6-metoxy-1,4-benzoquinol methylase